jgi:hypothetical protein
MNHVDPLCVDVCEHAYGAVRCVRACVRVAVSVSRVSGKTMWSKYYCPVYCTVL